ncbi:betaine/proline/choline family ABC transporter ATP-binding protein [Saccharopolyspora erythraea]|uniref:quaternary amine ABC transporter ATP-binding protein n=1 Tax=Saccharopolyspora erythraea TaxID=1836 RepID=UPI001BA5AD96|nr:betaine/proline/choline family ABC transporter ATP-binding protein [Saccharopolyspora erythraea]
MEQLFKIFGPQPAEVVRMLREGAGQDEVRAAGATPAVVDASFSVHDRETFVVMGLSGSGKSTLIRMLNGLLAPTSGRIHVDDEEITAMSAKALRTMRQRTMSMVFQHFALFPHRTVLDNAGYGLHVRGAGRDEIRTRALEALSLVGLEGWEQRYPQQLSGGMRQRVGLARALAAGTDVLLMDEAFSALDPLIKREMQDQLVDLQARLGKTIIFITHDLNEAMRLGDRIAVMRAGRIVQIGTSEQILDEPADDYVAKFIRDVDRSRVLTAADVVRTAGGDGSGERGDLDEALARLRERHVVGDPVVSTTPMHELFPLMTGEGTVLPVIDGQRRLLGVITADGLFEALNPAARRHRDD